MTTNPNSRTRGVAQRTVGIIALIAAVILGAGALITYSTVGMTTTTTTTQTRTPAPSTSTSTSEEARVNHVTPRMNARGKANQRAARADEAGCRSLAQGDREARYRCLERSPYWDVPPRQTTTITHTSKVRVSQSPTTTVLNAERPHKAGGVAVIALRGLAGIAALSGIILIIGSLIKPNADAKHARGNWEPVHGVNPWEPPQPSQHYAPQPAYAPQPEPSHYSPQPPNAAEYPAYAVDSEGDVTPPPPFEVNAPTEPQDTPQQPTDPNRSEGYGGAADNRPPTAGGSLEDLF